MSVKHLLRRLVPPHLYFLYKNRNSYLSIAKYFFSDYLRYVRFCRDIGQQDIYQHRAAIIAHYHVLEKGLAMPVRKSIFGEAVAKSLQSLLDSWSNKDYGLDSQIQAATDVLECYYSVVNNDSQLSGDSSSYCLVTSRTKQSIGGVQLLFRDDILEKANGNFASLAQARRSIRTYSSTPVEEDLIKEAVRLASSSPSVCNRQATSICCIMNKDLINDILKLQNGNRGFGHLVQCLLLVNVDIRAFQGANERNQCWVDGGLFSMSLLYAISYLGLVSCPLNWCVDENKSRQLRVLMSYGDNINTIMMVAVGHPEEQMIVPFSHRFSLAEIFTCIK